MRPNNREQGHWSFKQPGEVVTLPEVMKYGTTKEKIGILLPEVAAATIVTGVLAGPFIAGAVFDLVGTITQNPEMIQSGNGLMLLEGEIWGGTFSLMGLVKGIKSMASRLRIQKTPEQILVTISKTPILNRN